MRALRLSLLLSLSLLLLLAPATETPSLGQERDSIPNAQAEQVDTGDAHTTRPESAEKVEDSKVETPLVVETPQKAETRESAETPKPADNPPPAAQEQPSQPHTAEKTPRKEEESKTQAAAVALPNLPATSLTQHTLELGDRSLQFEAVAGAISLTNSEGRVQAQIAYVSYTLAGADSRLRPVAFVFNGGPGSSSAWLHLGTLGPWRVPLEGEGARPSAPGVPLPNADTWLDFCDLVMVDPIGTGYSRFEADPSDASKTTGSPNDTARRSGGGRDLKKQFWSISGDVDSIANFISQWLTKTGRRTSPKVLVGESYGGFRAPKIARALQSDYGVGINLLVLVSPVLDYGFLRGQRHLPFGTVTLLPSLSAAALEARGKTPSAALMREAEDYARGDYLSDLLRGPRDAAAVGRVVKRVTSLTGLPAATVQKYGGRLDSYDYRREANATGGQVASAYDASVKGLHPDPSAPNSRAQDPFVTALRAPLTTAVLDVYATKLNWRPEGRYQLMNTEVASHWQYGNSPASPEAVSDLKSVLTLDARMRVLVAHGYTDLVTPYFASTLLLDQLPAYGDARRVFQVTYPGGHMFYSRDASRSAFREDVLIMLAASLTGEAQTR